MPDKNPPLSQGDTSYSPTLDAVRRAGEWFLANQDDSFLYYEYDTADNRWPEGHQVTREIASLWSIALIANLFDDSRFRALADRGIQHFERAFQRDPQNNMMVMGSMPDEFKLSYSAFAILSLLEIDHPKRDSYLEQFANGILYQQEADGQFRSLFGSDDDSGRDYYPGQAMLALMSLYERTGRKIYLESVERAFPFYRSYWRENVNTAFIPWQTQAYVKLVRATENPAVGDFVFDMNDYIIRFMSKDGEPGNFDFSIGIVTAVYMEGVTKAYQLARDWGDRRREALYGRFVSEGSQAVMALQCPVAGQDPETCAKPALGGFFGSQGDTMMRVDRNQHAIMALMAAHALGLSD